MSFHKYTEWLHNHEFIYMYWYFAVFQKCETAALRDFIYFSRRCENKWQINVDSSTCFVFVINLMFFFQIKVVYLVQIVSLLGVCILQFFNTMIIGGLVFSFVPGAMLLMYFQVIGMKFDLFDLPIYGKM